MISGYSVVDTIPAQAPRLWQELYSLSGRERGQYLAQLNAIAAAPCMAGAIQRASSVEALAPVRSRDKTKLPMWRLGVLGLREAILFSAPVQLESNLPCPRQFRNFVETIGSLQFGVFSGYMLLPSAGALLANDIVLPLYRGAGFAGFLPFFDHQSGDYDGWLTERDHQYVEFNHETGDFESLSVSSFAEWLNSITDQKLNS